MTLALSIKVNDGLIFAADSASTIAAFDGEGNLAGVSTVYNNANKVFNLRKGAPIGAITWGLGSIGIESIETLIKDFRVELTHGRSAGSISPLDLASYTVQEVADRFYRFIYDDRYLKTYPERSKVGMDMGFIIGGYSAGIGVAEEFLLEIDDAGGCTGPKEIFPGEAGAISGRGQPEAIYRLLQGYGTDLPIVLERDLGVPTEQIPQVLDVLTNGLGIPLVIPAMPIQDAIDVAAFLVDVAVRFSRFTPGPSTIGGPIEIATITKHEGFKWIKRKYYYSRDLNP